MCEAHEKYTLHKSRRTSVVVDSGSLQPTKGTLVACDTSAYSIATVLSQHKDCLEVPFAFASRIPKGPAEDNCSQLQKRSLALVFGVMRFRNYLLAHDFVLITDHKPLVGTFGEGKL